MFIFNFIIIIINDKYYNIILINIILMLYLHNKYYILHT